MSKRRWRDYWDGSPSKLKRFERCALAYRFRYVDRIKDPTGPEGRVGLLVHGALEIVGRARIGETAPRAASAAELLEALGGSIEEGRNPTSEDLQAAYDLVGMLAPFDVSAGGEVLGVELEGEIELEGGVTFGMYFDLVRRREDGVVEGVDWKTGQQRTRTDLEMDPQAQLGLAALRDAYPEDDVAVAFVFLADGWVKTTQIEWREGLDQMGRGRALAAHWSWSRGTGDASVDLDSCRYCFARDKCGPYRDALERVETPSVEPVEARDLPIAAILEERHRFSTIAKAADQRRKDLDVEIKRHLGRADGDKLEAEGFSAKIRERKAGGYDIGVLPELAAELALDPYDVLRECGSVKAAKVKAMIKGNPDAKAVADKYRKPGSTRYVEVRAVKKAKQ